MTVVQDEWLLVSVHTANVAALRVYVWRTLRGLGAVYVQQSVCLLPDLPPVTRAMRRLVARVQQQGGQARSLRVQLVDSAERDALIAEQQADRDVEYGEVVERVPQLLAEIEQETARGRATFAEVEESEADLQRFQRWMARIEARDYFAAPGGQAARDAVARCATALAAFETAALNADAEGGQAPPAGQARRRLRAVPDE